MNTEQKPRIKAVELTDGTRHITVPDTSDKKCRIGCSLYALCFDALGFDCCLAEASTLLDMHFEQVL